MSTDYAKYITTQFHLMNCASCGIAHYIPDWKYQRAQSGSDWYCPNGHVLILRESELQKEKKRREWAERSRDDYQRYWKEEERRRIALKGVLTKTKNRIQNGVCPCCQRSFLNLKNHLKTKHPEWPENEKR